MKLRLNILIPIVRFAFSCLFLFVIILFLKESITGRLFIKDGIAVGLLSLIIVIVLFGYFVLNIGKAFLFETKGYKFYDDCFEVTDYLRFTKYRIEYKNLTGYRNANYVSKIAKFKEIILLVDDKRIYRIKQFSYLNFRYLLPELRKHNIAYLGFDNPLWNFFKKRFYEK